MGAELSTAAAGFGTGITTASTNFIGALTDVLGVVATKEILGALILIGIVYGLFRRFKPRG